MQKNCKNNKKQICKINFKKLNKKDLKNQSYFIFPKYILTDDIFKDISNDSKILYCYLYDRVSLSIRHKKYDKNGNLFIICPIKEVMNILNCQTQKAVKCMNELEKKGLISKVYKGYYQPNYIYVHDFNDFDDFENQNNCLNQGYEIQNEYNFEFHNLNNFENQNDLDFENQIQSYLYSNPKLYNLINHPLIDNDFGKELFNFFEKISISKEKNKLLFQYLDQKLSITDNLVTFAFNNEFQEFYYFLKILSVIINVCSLNENEEVRIGKLKYDAKIIKNKIQIVKYEQLRDLISFLVENPDTEINNFKNYIIMTLINFKKIGD